MPAHENENTINRKAFENGHSLLENAIFKDFTQTHRGKNQFKKTETRITQWQNE